MEIKPIRVESDYNASLARFEALRGAAKDTTEDDEAEILYTLIKVYEKDNYPVTGPVKRHLKGRLNTTRAIVFSFMRHLIEKPVDLTKLPVTGEGFYKKPTGDKYGHIIIRIEPEPENPGDPFQSWGDYSFAWLVDDKTIPYEYFKPHIEPVLNEFAFLLAFFKWSETPIRISIIGGSFRFNEQPLSFKEATIRAIKDALQKLNGEI